ncbi:MAG TPA: sigma-70 family RNA polymerase sigma factor [Hymenobacter sp.]|uniref:RNA polymerase sigma factor n=1 Tax=Hymenobacter sp. TaxID=1898978 RepID=UPI002ED872B7
MPTRAAGPAASSTQPTPAVPPATEEELLVHRLLARDERALQLLSERYGHNLLTVILRLVRDRELAEDVLQEGLLRVWMSIGSYDATRGGLFTWMVRVCCNRAIDVLRSPRHRFHRHNKPLDSPGVSQAPASVTFNPEHIGLRELTRMLQPRQRQVIELLYFGGCTQAEAAKQLGIPLPTLKTRARAGLRVLAQLTREGQGQPPTAAPQPRP